ncbi:MAG: tetratricopeptide repeat protein [Elusimicrobiales bacterium]
MGPLKISQLLLRRLGGRAAGRPAGLYERALTLGHAGNIPGMRRLFYEFLKTARADEDPEKLFRALLELGLYARAFGLAEKLIVRPGADRLVIKDPFIDIRFSPPPGYYEGHLAALGRLRAAGRSARWKHYYSGALLRRLNRLREAAAAFDLAGEWPRAAWLRFQRGWTLLNLGTDLARAAADLRAAAGADRSDWVARCLLGEALVCAGRAKEGLGHFGRAAAAAPAHAADIAAWRAQLRLILGDYRGAVKDLLPANRAKSVFSRCWLGAARLCLGQKAPALRLLAQAVKLLPGDAEARLWYCEALRLSGRRAAAWRQLRLAGDGNWARANRTLLLAQAGRYRQAYVWYQKLDAGIRLRLEKAAGLAPVDAGNLTSLMEFLFRKSLGNRTDKVYLYSRWFTPPPGR